MPWLELSLITDRRQLERIERALQEGGALSVTLTDPEDAAPIFEPKPGETPLWRTLKVTALFAADVDRRGLMLLLHDFLPWVDQDTIALQEVADADWTRAWMDQYQPMRFGARLWVVPSTHEPPSDADSIVLRLDPGLAFGSGTHATTALCLAWLDGQDLAGKRVLDYGCGSGILAVAALKLGAARALGIDLDPQALLSSRANADLNGVTDTLDLGDGTAALAPGFDLAVANILSGALIHLAPTICASLVAGAPLALSGILAGQEHEVMVCYAAWCDELVATEREGWMLVSGRRAGSTAA